MGGNQGTKEQFASSFCLHCQYLFVAQLHPNVLAFHAVDVAFPPRLSRKGQYRRQNSNQLVFACHLQNPAQIYQLCAAPDSIHLNQVNNQGVQPATQAFTRQLLRRSVWEIALCTQNCLVRFLKKKWNDRMRKRGFATFCLETPFCNRPGSRVLMMALQEYPCHLDDCVLTCL